MGPGFESLKVHQQRRLQPIQYRRCVGSFSNSLAAVSVFSGEGPPVPIPNTVVKLAGAEDTCLETDRENREMPTQCGGSALAGQSLLYIPP